ncbi:MAG: outer membrane beta-barrel protein [Crocinitomicaceae bacterium]|nr:outer membrane beta-barrel protein [Crocinitomicaceae bacterium]
MKRAALLVICLMTLGSAFSQDFVKGGNYISLGYGLDPYRGSSNIGNNYIGHGGGVAYERGVTDVLGIGRIGAGGGISTMFYSYHSSISDFNTVRLTLSARATYHFEFDVPKLDVYAGLGFAFNMDFEETNIIGLTNKKKNTHIGRPNYHQVFAGIRYYFTDAFGVYAEFGHGHRAASAGVVFSF